MLSEPKKSGLAKSLALIGLMALMCTGATGGGCAAQDMALGSDEDTGTLDDRMLEAQAELANHDLEQAQYIYGQILVEQQEAPGAAYAGKALTDLLLLPGAESTTTVLVEHLGATSGVDANDTIYAEEGFLYWKVRGVPWDDEGTYPGIRSLIADELPWSAEQLSAMRAFFTGLETPGDDIMDDLVLMADAMGQIENDLQRALEDPEFELLYIPGPTFHSDELDLLLGRSEIQFIRSVLAATRGSIYLIAAYEHTWTLDEVLGAQSTARENPRSGWTTVDYALDYLDSRLVRKVRDPLRLQEARTAFSASLAAAVDSIRLGVDQKSETTMRWSEADDAYAGELMAFLEAVRGSLYGPTELPGSTPKTTMDLSSFFEEDGRVLAPELRWFERVEAVDQPETYWQLSDEAVQTFFVDGVFEPGFSVAEGNGPTLRINDERSQKFQQTLGGDVENAVEDAFFTTQ